MVVDTSYYDLLQLPPTATLLEIKKAYRKAAIRLHPDKSPDDPEAHARFQEVGQAYQVLSDEKLREKYDKFGVQESIPSEGFGDPAEFFTQIFGGDAFKDWIGELSLLLELSKSAELSGDSDENSGETTAPKESPKTGHSHEDSQHGSGVTTAKSGDSTIYGSSSQRTDFVTAANSVLGHDDKTHIDTPVAAGKPPLLLEDGQTEPGTSPAEEVEKKRRQEELEKFEEECRLKKIETRNELAKNLVKKLYLYTELDMAEDVTESFRQKMRYEAESLKMESFGLEILHLLGSIYKTKAKILLKSQTFLGGLGGLWWLMKDKGGVVRDTFKTVASALDAQLTMQEYTKMQEYNEYHAKVEAEAEKTQASELEKSQRVVERSEEELQKTKEQSAAQNSAKHWPESENEAGTTISKDKPKVPEKHTQEDLQEMEKFLIGKVLAAAWSGLKFEIQGTVRAVCDQILYDKELSPETRLARARGLKILGLVFSETSRTELEAEEARVFEELVAEASHKRRRRKPQETEA